MWHAFNDDTILQQTFAELVTKYNPALLIETGTHHGYTTEFMLSFGVPVITTEINPQLYHEAKQRLGPNPLLSLVNDDSARALANVRDEHKQTRAIAFLDAHWHSDSALDRELAQLATWPMKPVILVHDFKVPGKDFGYDNWDGHDYDYEFYKPAFDKIYGEGGYTYRYNEEATGLRRGVIILEPIDK